MADFRKYVVAFAGLACMLGVTGKASAQFGNGFACTANASTPFDMRAQGITEQAGDIVLQCTGGTVTALGALIPQVDVTVSANTNITSRLVNGSSTVTEALLLTDEPAPGALSICPASGSTTINQCQMTGTGLGGGNGSPTYNPLANQTIYGTGPRYNGFQGTLVSNSQVTFFGVPVDPPGQNALVIAGTTIAVTPTLTLRVTNIRVNASALGAPSGFTVNSVFETISTSAGFPITGAVQTVGSVRQGLIVTSVAGPGNTGTPSGLQQCISQTVGTSSTASNFVEYVNFSEGFATATKLPTVNPAGLGSTTSNSPGVLAIPGNPQNTESQFVPLNNSQAGRVGVADYGTRIQIAFNNIQSGVTIYVPTSLGSNQLIGAVPDETLTLTSSAAGSFSAVSASSVTNLAANYAAITATSGSAVAVYEVTSQLTQSPATIDTFSLPIIIAYTAAPGSTPASPGLGTSTVNVDFAPLSTVITASSSNIPRFVQTSSAVNGFRISACQTVLLFPFASNLAGFDTGLAISATSTDPFGTVPQSGTCTMNFYGSAAPAAFTTPNVPSGTSYTALLSTVAPGFQGYIIAQCRFQYGHGFAFITDGFGGPGRGLSEGYLALVIPDPGTTSGSRNPSPLSVAASNSGENIAN